MHVQYRLFFTILLVVIITLGGCAKKNEQPKQVVVVDYYPACHEPLAYLKSRNEGAGKSMAGGVLKGGIISGIASVIAGAITGNLRGVGVLAGAAAGGAVGGIVSGLNHHEEVEREDARHLAKYLDQIDGDIAGMNIVSAAATVSMQCYNREYQELLAGVKDKTITPEAGRQRLTEIIAGRDEAAQLLGVQANNGSLEDQFREAEK